MVPQLLIVSNFASTCQLILLTLTVLAGTSVLWQEEQNVLFCPSGNGRGKALCASDTLGQSPVDLPVHT